MSAPTCPSCSSGWPTPWASPTTASGDGSRAVRAVRRILAELDFPVLPTSASPRTTSTSLADLALADYFITMSPEPWTKDEVVAAFASALRLGTRAA